MNSRIPFQRKSSAKKIICCRDHTSEIHIPRRFLCGRVAACDLVLAFHTFEVLTRAYRIAKAGGGGGGGGGLNVTGRSQQYDVAPDGRCLINVESESSSPPITLLMNWHPERGK